MYHVVKCGDHLGGLGSCLFFWRS